MDWRKQQPHDESDDDNDPDEPGISLHVDPLTVVLVLAFVIATYLCEHNVVASL